MFNISSPSHSALNVTDDEGSFPNLCESVEGLFFITRNVLTIPFSVLVLFVGHRRWRQQGSCRMISHSNFFTYHTAAAELILPIATIFFLLVIFDVLPHTLTVVVVVSSVVFNVQTSCHLLTCVECYLAVVHPVTYRGLRNELSVRIRNITMGCVWIISVIVSGVGKFFSSSIITPFFCVLVFLLISVSFCCLSVLWVLHRPGPGDGGPEGKPVDPVKQRAFVTITVIMGVLWFWFGGFLVAVIVSRSTLLSKSVQCIVQSCGMFFSLPSSLMLPVLYLHRMVNLSCCCSPR